MNTDPWTCRQKGRERGERSSLCGSTSPRDKTLIILSPGSSQPSLSKISYLLVPPPILIPSSWIPASTPNPSPFWPSHCEGCCPLATPTPHCRTHRQPLNERKYFQISLNFCLHHRILAIPHTTAHTSFPQRNWRKRRINGKRANPREADYF